MTTFAISTRESANQSTVSLFRIRSRRSNSARGFNTWLATFADSPCSQDGALVSRIISAMWRMARPTDDEFLVEMCLRLYDEDPGPLPVPAENMLATLKALRREPWLGRAVVLEVQEQLSGYALLIAFWSNEFGGSVCEVDELFVAPEHRSQGHGKALFAAIAEGDLWPIRIVAIALGVTPDNVRARRFYERLGFAAVGVSMVRRLQ